MKVILLHNVKKIGKKGEICEVADGYANGFLLPKKLAKVATNDAVKQLENEQKQADAVSETEKKNFKKIFDSVNKKHITIHANVNNQGHLFAAVGAKDISIALQNNSGIIVDPQYIVVEQPIKEIGDYTVLVEVGENRGEMTVSIEGK